MEKSRVQAQHEADRICTLREALESSDVAAVLSLTEEQQLRFSAWADVQLVSLATQFDVDTTASQKRMSWGMRIASTCRSLSARVSASSSSKARYQTLPTRCTCAMGPPSNLG